MDKVLQDMVNDFFIDAGEPVLEGEKELKKEKIVKKEKTVKKYLFVKNVIHDNIFYETGNLCPENLVDVLLTKDFIKSE